MERLKNEIARLLDTGTDANTITELVELAIEAHGKFALWGDGTWRPNEVCSICGSPYSGICGHGNDPKQRIVFASEFRKATEGTAH